MAAYYNDSDAFCAAWLRELIREGLIADGDVDERSIAEVTAADVQGYTQAHFFAGIGGWSYALRLAGWPDGRAAWTGSCPCQPFSSAARGRTVASDVWPEFGRLIRDTRPGVVFGEQVARAQAWFDRIVCADLEALGYTVGAAILPAVFVGADHARERIYFVGHADSHSESGRAVDAEMDRLSRRGHQQTQHVSAHGVSREMDILCGFGNAIYPQVAAVFIEAYMQGDAVTIPQTGRG